MSRGLTFPQLRVALLFGAIATLACLMPAQSDTYWHLRAGQEIWRTLRVPMDEHYSFTAAGNRWPNHEWLWQALSYALYRGGGMPGLALGGGAAVVSAFAIVYRLTVGAPSVRFLLTVVAVPLSSWIWALRPQIVTLLCLAIMLWLLMRERPRWLPLLFLLWANVHGAVALGGLALIAATVVAALRARRGQDSDRRRALELGVLLPVCAAATMMTPLGIGLWRFIPDSMTLSRQTQMIEWLPTYPTAPAEIAFWAMGAAFVALLFARARRLAAAPWADQVSVAVAAALLPLAFRAVRNTSPFLLAALPAASRLIGGRFRLWPGRRATTDHPAANLALAVLLFGGGAAYVARAWANPLPRLGWQPIAPGALAAVRDCPAATYNRYNEGGFLIWFAPERRVFIDSRQDPYPLPFLLEALAAEQGAPHRALFDRYAIRCAFLPVTSPLVAALQSDGWRTGYRDGLWAVLRPGAF